MNLLDLLLLILATWRLSSMLTQESGPFAIFDRLRFAVGATPTECHDQVTTGTITNAFCCVKCLSVWVAPVMLVAGIYAPAVVWLFAVSAGAILVQRWMR
jgi:hypothetical protein